MYAVPLKIQSVYRLSLASSAELLVLRDCVINWRFLDEFYQFKKKKKTGYFRPCVVLQHCPFKSLKVFVVEYYLEQMLIFLRKQMLPPKDLPMFVYITVHRRTENLP